MHVHLVVHRSLFHPKFVAHEVDQHNRKHPRAVNKAAFYHGVVRGIMHSSLLYYWNVIIALTSITYKLSAFKKHDFLPVSQFREGDRNLCSYHG